MHSAINKIACVDEDNNKIDYSNIDMFKLILDRKYLCLVFDKNENGMLALVPGQYDTDGFFIAKLRRKV